MTSRSYSRAKPSCTPPHLFGLPAELIISILRLCCIGDIKRTSETCRFLRDIGIPELYRVVDLSSHNDTSFVCRDLRAGDHRVPLDFFERTWTRLDYTVFLRQEAFVRTINERPDIGKHVCRLRWTVLDLLHPEYEPWDDLKMRDNFDSQREAHDHALYGDKAVPCENYYYYADDTSAHELRANALWRTFRSFVNVSSIDICWLIERRWVHIPASLFPSATSVRLTGIMTRELVDCILSTSSKQIKNLELNNLLQWSEIEPPLPKFATSHDLNQYWKNHSAQHSTLPDTRHMAGALDLYVGNCASLTSLCITTVGNGTFARLDCAWDDRRYVSWARFIHSVRNNLSYLCFKQGVSFSDQDVRRAFRLGRPIRDLRDMDHRFIEVILPVLLEAAWPKMKRMEIRGVGKFSRSWTSVHLPTEMEMAEPDTHYQMREAYDYASTSQYSIVMFQPAFTHAARDELRQLLPSNANLIVEEQQDKDYEHLWDEDNGMPILDEAENS